MGHLGISVHARAPAIECSNRGQVIWLVLIGKRALCNRMSLVNDVTPPPNGASHDQRAYTRTSVASLLAVTKSARSVWGHSCGSWQACGTSGRVYSVTAG